MAKYKCAFCGKSRHGTVLVTRDYTEQIIRATGKDEVRGYITLPRCSVGKKIKIIIKE